MSQSHPTTSPLPANAPASRSRTRGHATRVKGDGSTPLLEIRDLEVAFRSSTGMVPAVRKANLTMFPGQAVAIVGESGSGKSTLAHSVIGLLPGTGRVTGGSIQFAGRELVGAPQSEIEALRGSEIGLVPQDPMTNLNPVWNIGFQIKEALRANGIASGSDAETRAAAVLEEAGLKGAESRMKQYPHEFSGGMRQRALIGMALAGEPQLIIADELTSALDVTVQKVILDHLERLTQEHHVALLFITHDLGLAAERAEHLVVMHRGRVVESGPSEQIIRTPVHPYTKRLVDAAPSLASHRIQARHEMELEETGGELVVEEEVPSSKAILELENLTKVFQIRGSRTKEAGDFKAVDNVSLTVERGTTMALVGESGSGKSTIANMVLGLLEPTEGRIVFDGVDTSTLNRRQWFDFRSKVQPVFQNPYGSLDPMYSVYRVIEEPLRVHGVGNSKERAARVAELLELVALPTSAMRRYPNELSGGQRQRVAVARALALSPSMVVLDEAVSALDVLVQAQVLKLLAELQEELKLTYLFITHDLAVVRQIADRVAVMSQGQVLETGTVEEIFDNPQDPYTQQLLAAIPGASLELY